MLLAKDGELRVDDNTGDDRFPLITYDEYIAMRPNESNAIYLPTEIMEYTDCMGINKNLVKTIFDNNELLEDVMNCFTEGDDTFCLKCFKSEGKHIEFSKTEFLYAVQEMMKKKELFLDEQSNKNFEKLLKNSDTQSMINEYQDDIYNIYPNNIKIQLPFVVIKHFFVDTDKMFEKFIRTYNYKRFNITMDEYMYGVGCFIRNEKLLDRYKFSDTINKRIDGLLSYNICDFAYLDNFEPQTDEIVERVKLSQNLKNYVLSNIPKDYNELQKTCLIYDKLCYYLTYDENFFATNQKQSKSIIKHNNLEYFEKINAKHNKVVCYEFGIIYAKLLSEMGLDYIVVEDMAENLNVSNILLDDIKHTSKLNGNHQSIVFRVGKYIVSADAMRKLFVSDLTNAKLHNKMKFLRCLNTNEKSLIEFTTTKNLVEKRFYSQIDKDLDKELLNGSNDEQELFARGLEYKYARDVIADLNNKDFSNLTSLEKEEIMIKSLQKAPLVGIENFGFMRNIKKCIYGNSDAKCEKEITIVYGQKNSKDYKKGDKISCAILVFGDALKTAKQARSYYTFDDEDGLQKTNLETLQKQFDNDEIGQVEQMMKEEFIPGLFLGIDNGLSLE